MTTKKVLPTDEADELMATWVPWALLQVKDDVEHRITAGTAASVLASMQFDEARVAAVANEPELFLDDAPFKGSFSYLTAGVQEHGISENVKARITRLDEEIARIDFIDDKGTAYNKVPPGITVRNTLTGVAPPVQPPGGFYITWHSNYAVAYDGNDVLRLVNQKQQAVLAGQQCDLRVVSMEKALQLRASRLGITVEEAGSRLRTAAEESYNLYKQLTRKQRNKYTRVTSTL